jgi:hypothetical protein
MSPAAKAKGLKQGMLQTFVHLAPQSLFLAFGARRPLCRSCVLFSIARTVLPTGLNSPAFLRPPRQQRNDEISALLALFRHACKLRTPD